MAWPSNCMAFLANINLAWIKTTNLVNCSHEFGNWKTMEEQEADLRKMGVIWNWHNVARD